jgi:type III restriction enzyme
VEQILGRVLRMPGAVRKQHDDLNHAYAYATSTGFIDSAKGLEDALVQSGFERFEARVNVKQSELELPPGVTFHITVSEPIATPPDLDKLPAPLKEKIRYEPLKQQITYTGTPLTDEETKVLQECVATSEDKRAVERLSLRSAGKEFWPSAKGEKFAVPRLAVRIQGTLGLLEDQFRDFVWKLAECDETLSEEEFSTADESAQAAEVDVSEKGKVETRYIAELHEQLSLLEMRGPQTAAELSLWLDRQILHPDIPLYDSRLFLMKMVQALIETRSATLEQLVRHRFRLRDAARAKIQLHREAANVKAFQSYLFSDMADAIEVDPGLCFEFPNSYYPANKYYQGSFKFSKHFYEAPADMNPEEARCAITIDSSAKVKYWVRNVERSEYSFWLPTSSDRFFPDFVALLTDGRFLVVEYKGEHLVTAADAKEKDMVGKLWEAKSGVNCVFRMVTKSDMEATLRAVLT